MQHVHSKTSLIISFSRVQPAQRFESLLIKQFKYLRGTRLLKWLNQFAGQTNRKQILRKFTLPVKFTGRIYRAVNVLHVLKPRHGLIVHSFYDMRATQIVETENKLGFFLGGGGNSNDLKTRKFLQSEQPSSCECKSPRDV